MRLRVAMTATEDERCGIAIYSRSLREALRDFVDIDFVPLRAGRQSKSYYRALAARLNDSPLVHIQHEYSFWGGIMPWRSTYERFRRQIRRPLIVTTHTTSGIADLGHSRLNHLAAQILGRWTAYRKSVEIAPFTGTQLCIVPTQAGRHVLVGRGIPAARIRVIPHPVPSVVFDPLGGRSFREAHGLAGRRLITIFGFLTPHKGYELTLRVLPKLPSDVCLIIAGGARVPAQHVYGDKLASMIRGSGLKNRVIVTGFLPEDVLAQVMAASDLVLVPHTLATSSYSVMVALAYGKPVLASDLACFREIRERRPCVALFRKGDGLDYACRLRTLLEDQAYREELAEQARRFAVENTWPNVARQTADLYAAILNERMA